MKRILFLLAFCLSMCAQTPLPSPSGGGGAAPPSGVTSFNSRTGAVVPAQSDYTFKLASDFFVTKASGSQLNIAAGFDSTIGQSMGYNITTSGSGTDSVYLYYDANDAIVHAYVSVGSPADFGGTVTVDANATEFLSNSASRLIWIVTSTSGVWDAISATNDQRFPTPLSLIFAGTGISVSSNGPGRPRITGTPDHAITFVINGSNGAAITTGALGLFPAVNYACTIGKVIVSGAPSGSITVDIWKASGAIPTSGNKISASDPATLSSSQLSTDTTLTGWTKSVSIGDVFGGTIVTAATVTSVIVSIWCQ